jgi:hypothetical protein
MSNSNGAGGNSALAFGQPLPYTSDIIDNLGKLLRRDRGPSDSLIFGKSLAFLVDVPDQETKADCQEATEEDTPIGFAG